MNCLALVIGINQYDNLSPLKSAVNDAEAVGDKLKELKYAVTYSLDEDRTTVKRRIEIFEEEIADNNPDVVLFYFAGHGCIVNRCDCLLLKDALELISDNEPKNRVRSIELDDLCKQFRALGNQINIFIIDACRSEGTRSINASLNFGKNIHLPYQTFIAYSTSPGATAGDGEGHSFYTAKLLEYMNVEGLPIEQLFKIVRKEVYTATKQLPWEHSCLIADYQFNHGQNNIYYGAKYIAEAFEDKKYISKNSEAVEIIGLFKTYNFYRQEDALILFKKVYKNLDVNDKFVIGRNILQAAVGGCYKCIEEISYTNLSIYQIDDENPVLDGILYEMYFNSENIFRGNKLKGINFLRTLPQQKKFEQSFQFINNCLQPYYEYLYYIPGDKEIKTLYIKLLDTNVNSVFGGRLIKLTNVVINGDDIIDKLFSISSCYTQAEFYQFVSNQLGIPSEFLQIKYSISLEKEDIIVYENNKVEVL